MANYRDESIVGTALTPRETEVVAAYRNGATDQELADMFGYASSNGAGNVRRRALTKLGEYSPESVTRGGSRAPRKSAPVIPDTLRMLVDERARMLEMVSESESKLSALRDAANMDADAIIGAERARLQSAIDSAVAALSAFDGMDDSAHEAFVSTRIDAAATALQTAEESTSETVGKLREEIATVESFLTLKGVDLAEIDGTEEPATEEPATEEPATEEPATEEPATRGRRNRS